MIIGLTGSFGSGKTTISEIFKELGFEIINVDKLYHGIYEKNSRLKRKILREFKTTDRKELKQIVFNDSRKLELLNKLTHPAIIKEIKKKISEINEESGRKKDIIIDAPLLLESKAKNLVEKIIVIKTNKKNTIERIKKQRKEKYSDSEILQIIKSQMSLKEKLKFADFIIDNNRGITETKKQVKTIAKRIEIMRKLKILDEIN